VPLTASVIEFKVKVVFYWQVVRYVQIAASDVDTEMLQDAARQQNKEGK